MKEKAFRYLKLLLGFFPSKTPVGLTEFHKWADDIINTYQPPADERSIKFALSGMVMRLNPTEAYKSKRFFALCLHKACAAQVACAVMEEIKAEQVAKQKEAAQSAEATANKTVAPSEQQAAAQTH